MGSDNLTMVAQGLIMCNPLEIDCNIGNTYDRDSQESGDYIH